MTRMLHGGLEASGRLHTSRGFDALVIFTQMRSNHVNNCALVIDVTTSITAKSGRGFGRH
jgi:hypothetical protein